jgi:hypothetical protein
MHLSPGWRGWFGLSVQSAWPDLLAATLVASNNRARHPGIRALHSLLDKANWRKTLQTDAYNSLNRSSKSTETNRQSGSLDLLQMGAQSQSQGGFKVSQVAD